MSIESYPEFQLGHYVKLLGVRVVFGIYSTANASAINSIVSSCSLDVSRSDGMKRCLDEFATQYGYLIAIEAIEAYMTANALDKKIGDFNKKAKEATR